MTTFQLPLADRVIFITGAASGIGKATVAACRDAGARVVAADLQSAEATASINGLDSGDLAVSLNVAESEAVKAAMVGVKERFGRLDGLVNCAGINGQGSIDHINVETDPDGVRAVERLGDCRGNNRLRAALLDFGHEVTAHAVLSHPAERLVVGEVATQADLHKILAEYSARLDQAAHR